eukprot:TRINITY_DN57312_c0_g1_i1.p1 TRINITY_DN57312_c0_g1~~TRINITY_DN57312_c0_g1_i1.p1  ORF type:complete len:943 (+),score=161.60 TRINITY_DN57312_c0_g1_i1:131-2830(+)
MIKVVFEALRTRQANSGVSFDSIVDIVLCGLCGSELPLEEGAYWSSRFFLRPRRWVPLKGVCDTVDEMWRHHGVRMNHFGSKSYLAFAEHYHLLLALLAEGRGADRASQNASQAPHLQALLFKRRVRGPAYIWILGQLAENQYRFAQGTSPVAQRSALQYSRKILHSGDLEQLLALTDMRIPEAYLTMLGTMDECVVEEAVGYFEDCERVLTDPGEHCRAGLECSACARFRPHHSTRGLHLLTALLWRPNLQLSVRKAVSRLLLDVAAAQGRPPRRQAFGVLVQFLQTQLPYEDQTGRNLQAYIRNILTDAFQSPTPALVHALYCFPACFALLGVARDDVRQPATLEDVADQAKIWLRRARELAKLRSSGPPNWLAVIPLVAWVRHLSHADRVADAARAIAALLAVYKEAFLHAELPQVVDPTVMGGPPPAEWELEAPGYQRCRHSGHAHYVASGSDAGAAEVQMRVQASGPLRFMVDFLGLLDGLYDRLGPGAVREAVAELVAELLGESMDAALAERLAETTWYFQVLHLFTSLTAPKAPWLLSAGPAVAKMQESRPPEHPASWSLAAWQDELQRMNFGRFFMRALRTAIAPARATVRRPKWTATLLALLRAIWRNLLAMPAPPSAAKRPMGLRPPELEGLLQMPHDHESRSPPRPDVLLLDLVTHGIADFLFIDCLGGDNPSIGVGPALSHVHTADGHGNLDALWTLRDTGVSLLEDVGYMGKGHGVLLHSLGAQVTRRFVDEQLRLLSSPVPGVPEATLRLFRALQALRVPQVDALLHRADVQQHLGGSSTASSAATSAPPQGEAAEPILDHPLALHRFELAARRPRLPQLSKPPPPPPNLPRPVHAGSGKTETVVASGRGARPRSASAANASASAPSRRQRSSSSSAVAARGRLR